jgi:hypothetical protein
MRISLIAAAVATFTFVGLNAAEAETVPEKLMEDLQADFQFEDFQAAGIVGNLARETGNFRYMQEINPVVKGSRGGIGYSQWTGSRRVSFEAWADKQGFDDHLSYEANYGYLTEELNGRYKRVVDKVKDTKTVEEAARVFMKYYLVPHPKYTHLPERISYAKAYMDEDFSGAGCQENHEIYMQGHMVILKMCPEPDNTYPVSAALEGSDMFDENVLAQARVLEALGSVTISLPDAELSYSIDGDPAKIEDPFASIGERDLSYQIAMDEGNSRIEI